MRAPNPTAEIIAAELTPRERVALFCIASKTRLGNFGIGRRTRLTVRGLIEPHGSQLALTAPGRAVLVALTIIAQKLVAVAHGGGSNPLEPVLKDFNDHILSRRSSPSLMGLDSPPDVLINLRRVPFRE
jgi:hypothetical protein